MHTYFGNISKDELEDLDPSEVFVDKNGECYWYKAQITEEGELVIYDTVGRMVPLTLESVEPLLGILDTVLSYTNKIQSAQRMIEEYFDES